MIFTSVHEHSALDSARPAARAFRSAMKRIHHNKWFIGILVLLLVPVVWFFGMEWYGEWSWKKYCASARARGVKLYISEFLPAERIPDEENFAAMPMWREVWQADAPKMPEMVVADYEKPATPRKPGPRRTKMENA